MGLAAAVLALLLQILNPVWAAGMPMDEAGAEPGIAAVANAVDGLGDIPICHDGATDATPAHLPKRSGQDTHKHGLACAACHVCCHQQTPLPLGQVVPPPPRGSELRVAKAAVRAATPRGPPARGVWARGPPLFS